MGSTPSSPAPRTGGKTYHWSHLPPGTRWYDSNPGVKWETVVPKHPIPSDRFDQFANLAGRHDLPTAMARERAVRLVKNRHLKMIDIEHTCPTPQQLRAKPWYPSHLSDRAKADFERTYYQGYAKTYTTQVNAARRNGWARIGIYGWQPFQRIWWGLEDVSTKGLPGWQWHAYGRQIYESVDVLFPSLYCFYWSPRNVAYTLAIGDLNRLALVAAFEGIDGQAKTDKPFLPYYWGLLHGGGSGTRWWNGLPMPTEEVRAMVTLGFFTGQDGFVLWGWTANRNDHAPPIFAPNNRTARGAHTRLPAYFSVSQPFTATGRLPNNKPIRTRINRYDALHLLAHDNHTNSVRFRIVDPTLGITGVSDQQPVYTTPADRLAQHLRAKTEPVSAAIEAMALIKPVEFILRHGQAPIDVPAQQQFKDTSPIVRRVTLGNLNVVATYDPAVVHGGDPRHVTLHDFNGHTGMTLQLAADDQVRLYVIQTR